MIENDVWFIPLGDDPVLIYAPFHGLSTLVNRAMAQAVSDCLSDRMLPVPEEALWIKTLRKPGNRPAKKEGPPDPVFLGLIPTRGCMMRCAYCDFVTLRDHPVMSFSLISRAIDGYADVMRACKRDEWNIHFFGGEPFSAFREIVYAVNYARKKAADEEATVHFEVTTNGFYSGTRARWIAEYIDTVVLSLDGFPDVQNRHRPGPGGQESFQTVLGNADIFSRGSCEFILRSCVSAENVSGLAEWCAFLTERWQPEAVCLEPMIESPLARKNGLIPPDPDIFIWNWTKAFQILEKERIRLVCSSGDISALNNSLCPAGRDAMIVTPEGQIGSCWQLSEIQQSGNLDLHFGTVCPDGFRINSSLMNAERDLVEANRENCRGCFCYAHCAGGCVLNRHRNGGFCRMTKALTLWQLLRQLGYGQLGDRLFENKAFLDQLTAESDFRAFVPGNFLKIELSPDMTHSDTIPGWKSSCCEALEKCHSSDPDFGWLRDGSKILIADTARNFVKVLDGDEALRFQLEHSGLTDADVEIVWSALTDGKN